MGILGYYSSQQLTKYTNFELILALPHLYQPIDAWGLISFRLLNVLKLYLRNYNLKFNHNFRESELTQYSVYAIANELAHQWIGSWYVDVQK